MKTYITVHGLIKYQGKYLILQRADNRSNPGYWNCVTGHIKEEESVEEAVLREVKEETNLEGEIIKIGEPLIHHNRDTRWIILAYLIEIGDISHLVIDNNELQEYKWIDKNDEMVSKYKGFEDTLKVLEVL